MGKEIIILQRPRVIDVCDFISSQCGVSGVLAIVQVDGLNHECIQASLVGKINFVLKGSLVVKGNSVVLAVDKIVYLGLFVICRLCVSRAKNFLDLCIRH